MPSPPDRERRRSGALVAAVFVAVGVVLFARPVLGMGSLLPVDIVEQAAPWRADAPLGATPHNPYLSDTIDVHVHFASWADDLRSGTAAWWDRSVGGGIPVLKAGFSPLLWLYLVVPAWYAPGLVALARTLVAAALTYGFARELRTGRHAAVVAGIAYAVSGFMVGWSGWPQSNVAAFLPGLFWAVERVVRRPTPRRAVPLALVVAAMVVSNFPLITAYGLLAAAGYGLVRLLTGAGGLAHAVRAAVVAGWGLVLAGLLGSLHLLAFGEYFDWADNASRTRLPADTSIGSDYLPSFLFPRPFGAHHTGPAFWGEGQNWIETQSYAGLAVVVLAAVALATGLRRHGGTGDAATRAVAVRTLWATAIVGAWVSYAGGPLTEAVQSLPLLGQNSVGRARVLVNLALAVLAGLGVQAWIDARAGEPGVDLLRGLRSAVVGGAALVAVTLPAWWRWFDGARDRGLVIETARGVVLPVVAAALTVALLWWGRTASRRTGQRAVVALGVVVAVELLAAGVSVATVVDRDRADLTTDAHRAAIAVLDPGERMGADARTFFPNTGQVTGLDDMRGHLQTPAGWRALYRALDPDHFRPPGSVTNPWFTDVDLASPTLDRLGVGVWATDPRVPIAGTRGPAPDDGTGVALAPGRTVPGRSGVTEPDGGLRAVSVRVLDERPTGTLSAALRVGGEDGEDGEIVSSRVDLARVPPVDGWVDVGFVGFDPAPGRPVAVSFTLTDGDAITLAGGDGAVAFATVAADDGAELIRTGDVSLYARPSATAAWLTPDGVDGTATVTEAHGDEVVIAVDTAADAVVAVAQPDYPGWTAEVDGQTVAIVGVDGAFPGVPVPAGTHTVRLHYRPTHLTAAIVLTVLGVVGIVATCLLDRRRPGAGAVDTLAR